MLPEIPPYEEVITLVSDSGIQFVDFAFQMNPAKEPAGRFAMEVSDVPVRLFHNKEKDEFFYEKEPGVVERVKRYEEVSMSTSVSFLDRKWLPLPMFRFRAPADFDEGPCNWARMRLALLDTPDLNGNTHRLTLAFDTRLMDRGEKSRYLAPSEEDLATGARFRLAFTSAETNWFMSQHWLNDWLEELYREHFTQKTSDDLAEDVGNKQHLVHYLNVLSLLCNKVISGECSVEPKVNIPEFKLVSKRPSVGAPPIPVDLILDIGNSRTCGILIEDHAQAGSGLKQHYALQMRNLNEPDQVYVLPFESNVEFTQVSFGKDHLSVKSGRHNAFQWPSMARVGVEASQLAARRKGTEGSTGLSSPKRYLWDNAPYSHGWIFNTAYIRTDAKTDAVAAPFSSLLNDYGSPLYKNELSLPVFSPHYTRSSLMTFMLAEILTHALIQINSPAQRLRRGHSHIPRYLRAIILTIPPGMPNIERALFETRMEEARDLVWKAMGWDTSDEAPSDSILKEMPTITVKWDEASCGQLVYLYTEISENFAGHPEEFFSTLARPEKTDRSKITLATIDIGGGTTDLVITDYSTEGASLAGSNVRIIPEQRFRDSFKVAGDDIVLDVIRKFILPAFEQSLFAANIKEPDVLMAQLCGNESINAVDAVYRQQLTRQIFTPLALQLLKAYEGYDPEYPVAAEELTCAERLGANAISTAVQNYVNSAISRHQGMHSTVLDLGAVPLIFDLQAVHNYFLEGQLNINRTFNALLEVVNMYKCDALLLTGRPSNLPGVQGYIRRLMPLSPNRIIPMRNYRTGGWYPFHTNGRITDPKSTASVGAMLCWL
ncbi:MAG: virulence factor SrfB, partial [Alcaligenaceae bacterium]|nr:virulence factor SrfB [Alcaligenaceae bacterium]